MGLWGSKSKLPDEEIQAISEDTGCEFFSKTFFESLKSKSAWNSSDFDGVCALRNVNNRLKSNFYSYLEIYGGQGSN
jgi:hypothetical protein